MQKFIVEREIPGAGQLTTGQLQGISQQSCQVLHKMGPGIQWVESFVTPDKIYCVYLAESEDLIREHAAQGGVPANSLVPVERVIDPTTAKVVFND